MTSSIMRTIKSIVGFPERMNRSLLFDSNGDYRKTILLSGVGRSGTTWISNIINYKNEYRDVFEPFHPYRVRQASVFKYFQYLRPDNRDPALLNAARNILSGSFRNSWTDSYNRKRVASKRIVKDIRTNLMLKWIHTNFPEMPIVLLLRHPCAVAKSWFELQWGIPYGSNRTDLELCMSQKELVEDHLEPFRSIIDDVNDDFQKHIILWCVLTYIPLRQFKKGELHLAFYENFCIDPIPEIKRLFSFLNIETDETVLSKLSKPSPQTRKNSAIIKGESLINSWRKGVTIEQTQNAIEILDAFGLSSVYSQESLPNIDNREELFDSK